MPTLCAEDSGIPMKLKDIPKFEKPEKMKKKFLNWNNANTSLQ